MKNNATLLNNFFVLGKKNCFSYMITCNEFSIAIFKWIITYFQKINFNSNMANNDKYNPQNKSSQGSFIIFKV